MNRLTQRQADLLRTQRREITKALAIVHEIEVDTANLCDHENADPDCPGCHIAWDLATSKRSLVSLGSKVDIYLEHGPAPK